MNFHAHTLKDQPKESREPLFTPFGEGGQKKTGSDIAARYPLNMKCDHLRPSDFAASISSALMKRVKLMRTSSTASKAFSMRSLEAASRAASCPSPDTAANSAITCWFKLRLHRSARAFNARCSSSGKFRIVNVAMPAF